MQQVKPAPIKTSLLLGCSSPPKHHRALPPELELSIDLAAQQPPRAIQLQPQLPASPKPNSRDVDFIQRAASRQPDLASDPAEGHSEPAVAKALICEAKGRLVDPDRRADDDSRESHAQAVEDEASRAVLPQGPSCIEAVGLHRSCLQGQHKLRTAVSQPVDRNNAFHSPSHRSQACGQGPRSSQGSSEKRLQQSAAALPGGNPPDGTSHKSDVLAEQMAPCIPNATEAVRNDPEPASGMSEVPADHAKPATAEACLDSGKDRHAEQHNDPGPADCGQSLPGSAASGMSEVPADHEKPAADEACLDSSKDSGMSEVPADHAKPAAGEDCLDSGKDKHAEPHNDPGPADCGQTLPGASSNTNSNAGQPVSHANAAKTVSKAKRRRSSGIFPDTQTEYVAIPTSTKRQKADVLTSRQEEIAERHKQGEPRLPLVEAMYEWPAECCS